MQTRPGYTQVSGQFWTQPVQPEREPSVGGPAGRDAYGQAAGPLGHHGSVPPDPARVAPDMDVDVFALQWRRDRASGRECPSCKGKHDKTDCPLKNTICFACQKQGHIARACRSNPQGRAGQGQPRYGPSRDSPRGVNYVQAPQPTTPPPPGYQWALVPQEAGQGGYADAMGPLTGPPGRTAPGGASLSADIGTAWYSGVRAGHGLGLLVPARGQGAGAGRATITVRSDQPHPPAAINGDVVIMEIDTGAGVSIIDEHTLRQHWPNIVLQPSPLRLRAWNGTAVPVVGQVMVTAAFGGVSAQVAIHVGQGKGPTLLGRDWFWMLGFRVVHGAVPEWVTEINWAQLSAPQPGQQPPRGPGRAAGTGLVTAQQYLQRFSCFKSGLGRYNGPPVHLQVDPDFPPIRFRARPVPYARRQGVENEIDRLVNEGTFTPVTASKWQTPLVTVTKQDGSPRLCGDYRLTINKALQPDPYPLTTLDEAFAQLAGGTCFTKLDLAMAYAQLPVTEETAMMLTITTSKELFKVNRLAFGVSTAPAIFQRLIDGLLKGIPRVVVLLDDILIAGPNPEELNTLVEMVLSRLSDAGLRLKFAKCEFGLTSVT
ncbi:hypothetical protein KUF71_001007 [Frankliniella fusca]|uniref:CCHC-type domain-containing protein n=1 Tax=Frankliniella fusca TaxID=407009 RepID=A0AAE1HCQ2_9NEOP|nr:hypothetical protein KUF71_001007 [Frankliniella fusca]